MLIANKIFHVIVLLINSAMNLWHRKFVTAVFFNNQHGIQRRGQGFHTNFAFDGVHSKEVDTQISEAGNFLTCHLFAFYSISAEFLQQI